MKYEKPVVTFIDLGDNDIITSSMGGCDNAASQYADNWQETCDNKSHQSGCSNKAHRGENL